MALTPEQWMQAKALFGELHESGPEARAARLNREMREAGLDPAVAAEVQSLLKAEEGEAGLESIKLISRESLDEFLPAGTRFGPWRLLELLGRGGMGQVYRAARADGAYELQVAVKLLKRGVDTDAVLQRFLRERRILAGLSHPNIARLLDAGAAADGRPYLVMELVGGQPITDWCRQQQRSLPQILELMVGACEAVYAAHRQQIVHRDLKPSNILVGEDGAAKLLDFGIAKLLGEEDESTVTRMGSSPATPQYAAPEQLLGQPISAATDVYALGVLLYELLTGALPRWHQSTLSAMVAVQGDQAMTRPSAAVLQESESRSTVIGMPPKVRARELDGDLDQIVLKAMQRQPQRRYANAAELADDLRRYLDGRPVLARPDSAVYRIRKFVLRNWLPVSATAAVAVALIAGASLALWQAKVADRRADELRTVVDFQGAMLKRVNIRQFADGWLNQMREKLAATLEQSTPVPPDERAALLASFDRLRPWSQPAEVARQSLGEYLLTPAVSEIDHRFAGDPRTAARLRTGVAKAYDDLGLFDRAAELLRQTIAAASPALGADSPEVLAARLGLADALREQGHSADAIALAREVERQYRLQLGADHPDTLRAQALLAYALKAHQDTDQAIAILQTLLPKQRRILGDAAIDTLDSADWLAALYTDRGLYAEAKSLQESTLATARRVYGNDDPRTLDEVFTYAAVLNDMGDSAGAAKVDEELLDARRRTLGAEHPATIGALINLAAAVDDAGDKHRAFALKEAAYQLARRSQGVESRLTQASAINYGWAMEEHGRYREAEDLFREVMEVRMRTLGPDKPATLNAMSDLGSVWADQKRYAEAERLQQQALAGLRQALGPEHPNVLRIWRETALTLQSWGHDSDAAEQFRAMLEPFRKNLGADNADTFIVESALALSQFRLGQRDEALAQQRSLLQRAQAKLGEHHPATLQAMNDLAQSLHALHRDAEALPMQTRAVEGLSAQFGEDGARTVEARRQLQDIQQSLSEESGKQTLR